MDDVMQNEIENLELNESVNFEFIDWLKKQKRIVLDILWKFKEKVFQFQSIFLFCHCRMIGPIDYNLEDYQLFLSKYLRS